MRAARRFREAAGLSIHEAAGRIGAQPASISRFEVGAGLREPTMKAYAKLLGVSLEDLLATEPDPEAVSA